MKQRSPGLLAMSAFFLFGAVMSGLAAGSLLAPNGLLEPMWRVNPGAQARLVEMGRWAVVLMLTVCVACGLAAIGLWTGARWGHRLALGLLVVNLIGDVANAIVLGDRRTLIGVPIAVALIAYMMSAGVRATSPRATPGPRRG